MSTDKIIQGIDELKSQANASAKELKDKIANHESAIEQLQESIKAVRTSATGFKGQSFDDALGSALQKNAGKIKEMKTTKKGINLDLDVKVVGNMSSSGSLTGSYFATPSVVPGVAAKPYEAAHVRDFFTKTSTSSAAVRYVVDNGGEGGPTTVAEGNTKPQIDRDLEIKDAPVRKIATYFRVPEEMIEDIEYMRDFLSQIGVEEVMAAEDTQLLYGDGTGQNLTGLNTAGTAFAAGTSVIGATANQYDVIGAAKKQLRVAKYSGPLFALVNPSDYFDMRYKKDSTGNYLFQSNQGVTPMESALSVDGITVVEHTAVNAGGFFVFSPRAAQIVDRTGTSVRFFDQDQDNAIKNLWTIVIEKRLAFPIYHPGAIIRGTFSAAITDLTS